MRSVSCGDSEDEWHEEHLAIGEILVGLDNHIDQDLEDKGIAISRGTESQVAVSEPELQGDSGILNEVRLSPRRSRHPRDEEDRNYACEERRVDTSIPQDIPHAPVAISEGALVSQSETATTHVSEPTSCTPTSSEEEEVSALTPCKQRVCQESEGEGQKKQEEGGAVSYLEYPPYRPPSDHNTVTSDTCIGVTDVDVPIESNSSEFDSHSNNNLNSCPLELSSTINNRSSSHSLKINPSFEFPIDPLSSGSSSPSPSSSTTPSSHRISCQSQIDTPVPVKRSVLSLASTHTSQMASHVPHSNGKDNSLDVVKGGSVQDGGHISSTVDKGLKMKIKRKSVSSGRHEIVNDQNSCDDSQSSDRSTGGGSSGGGGGSSNGVARSSKQPKLSKEGEKDRERDKEERQGTNSIQKPAKPIASNTSNSNSNSTPSSCSSSNATKQNGPPISAPEINIVRKSSVGLNGEAGETKEAGTICSSIGIITEPDCLGVCEPGTSVLLEGIVWQETEGGVLVVNVTWRGKTYVGTLLDATRHDWAPPRLNEESDDRNRMAASCFGVTNSGRGTKRQASHSRSSLSSTSDDNGMSKLRNGKGRRSFTPVPASPGKCGSPVAADSPKVKKPLSEQQQSLSTNVTATTTTSSSAAAPTNNAAASTSNGKVTRVMAEEEDAVEEAAMLQCSEPDCHKKFKQLNGLRYHQTHAHNDKPTPQSCEQIMQLNGQNETHDSTEKTAANAESDTGINGKPDVKLESMSSSMPNNGASVQGAMPLLNGSIAPASATPNGTTTTSTKTTSNCDNEQHSQTPANGQVSSGLITPPVSETADAMTLSQQSSQLSPHGNDTDNQAAADVDMERNLTGGAASPAYSDISDDMNQHQQQSTIAVNSSNSNSSSSSATTNGTNPPAHPHNSNTTSHSPVPPASFANQKSSQQIGAPQTQNDSAQKSAASGQGAAGANLTAAQQLQLDQQNSALKLHHNKSDEKVQSLSALDKLTAATAGAGMNVGLGVGRHGAVPGLGLPTLPGMPSPLGIVLPGPQSNVPLPNSQSTTGVTPTTGASSSSSTSTTLSSPIMGVPPSGAPVMPGMGVTGASHRPPTPNLFSSFASLQHGHPHGPPKGVVGPHPGIPGGGVNSQLSQMAQMAQQMNIAAVAAAAAQSGQQMPGSPIVSSPSQPSPRGKATPPMPQHQSPRDGSDQQRLTPKSINQFLPQLGQEALNFGQPPQKRMSPSVQDVKGKPEHGGPSPKPPALPPGMPGFGAPPPGVFLAGNPFGAPFQSPFGLEAMYHQSYLERYGAAPTVPGAPPGAPQGKAALDILQQVSHQYSPAAVAAAAAATDSKLKIPGLSGSPSTPGPSIGLGLPPITPVDGLRSSSSTPGQLPAPLAVPAGASASSVPGLSAAGSSGRKESPPPQRHLHTHHHTHVGVGYPIYDPYSAAAMMATTPVGLHPFAPK